MELERGGCGGDVRNQGVGTLLYGQEIIDVRELPLNGHHAVRRYAGSVQHREGCVHCHDGQEAPFVTDQRQGRSKRRPGAAHHYWKSCCRKGDGVLQERQISDEVADPESSHGGEGEPVLPGNSDLMLDPVPDSRVAWLMETRPGAEGDQPDTPEPVKVQRGERRFNGGSIAGTEEETTLRTFRRSEPTGQLQEERLRLHGEHG